MNAVPFDTLKLAQSLEAAGLAPPVAAGTAAALAEAMTNSDLATKADLALLESNLIRRIEASDARHDARFDAVQAEMNTRFAAQQAEMNARFDAQDASVSTRFTAQQASTVSLAQSIDAKLELLRRDMVIKLGGMIFVAVGVILAAMRFMPHP